jgi:hypothetical protein
MRRSFLLLSSLILAMAVAAPVAAEPTLDHNKHFTTWLIACPAPLGTFTVHAKGVPGWPTDWEPSDANIHFRAAESVTWWWEGSIAFGPIEILAPKGLEEKLVGPCQMHLYGGTRATFDVEFVNAYYVYVKPVE